MIINADVFVPETKTVKAAIDSKKFPLLDKIEIVSCASIAVVWIGGNKDNFFQNGSIPCF